MLLKKEPELYDEISNTSLVAYAANDENATELEIELANRLHIAIGEIETLCQELTKERARGDDA